MLGKRGIINVVVKTMACREEVLNLALLRIVVYASSDEGGK